jgi:putative GTP pyrophosphokinase
MDEASSPLEPQPPQEPREQSVRDLVAARAGRPVLSESEQDEIAAGLRQVYEEFIALRMHYQFGIDEVLTKVEILRKEFEQMHDYSPIEHVRTRLKSVESLMEKALRTEGEMTVRAIRERVHDIAGIRITTSFVADAYWIADILAAQGDLEVLTVKDYIASPKPNGYRSLHLIVQVPVYLSTHVEQVPVELQIRTIAMDFWASTEHKLSYKYEKNLPPGCGPSSTTPPASRTSSTSAWSACAARSARRPHRAGAAACSRSGPERRAQRATHPAHPTRPADPERGAGHAADRRPLTRLSRMTGAASCARPAQPRPSCWRKARRYCGGMISPSPRSARAASIPQWGSRRKARPTRTTSA